MAVLRLFFLCLCAASLAAGGPASDLIKKTCSPTPYPSLCVKSLLTLPESQSADTHGLAELAIRVAAMMGTNTSAYITSLRARSGADDCLDYCAEQYENAIGQLDDSTGAMDHNEYGNVMKWLGAAIAEVETCEAGCKDAPLPDKVRFFKMSLEFRHLCKVIHSIVKLLSK